MSSGYDAARLGFKPEHAGIHENSGNGSMSLQNMVRVGWHMKESAVARQATKLQN